MERTRGSSGLWLPGRSPRGRACLRDGKKRPVLFYIHGGAYNNGTANAALYDGTRLAERGDVVVVTVNHRLNPFGFLYLAELAGLEARYKDSGNVGMMDLVLALEWVRDNIAEFGGDATRVTNLRPVRRAARGVPVPETAEQRRWTTQFAETLALVR